MNDVFDEGTVTRYVTSYVWSGAGIEPGTYLWQMERQRPIYMYISAVLIPDLVRLAKSPGYRPADHLCYYKKKSKQKT